MPKPDLPTYVKPEILAASSDQSMSGFYIKYRHHKKVWIEYQPYSYELYKELAEGGHLP